MVSTNPFSVASPCRANNPFLSALHAYAFDCVTHHLFHPYGTNSLEDEKDEEIMREVTFDDSLQSKKPSLLRCLYE